MRTPKTVRDIWRHFKSIPETQPVAAIHVEGTGTVVARVRFGEDWQVIIEAVFEGPQGPDPDYCDDRSTSFICWEDDGTDPYPIESGEYRKCYEAMRQRVREIVAW